jgi:DNA invertase Pin-like site-specific DNA recombinase
MVAQPGPDFRWGVLLRRSTLNKALDEYGRVRRFEDSTERQELEVVWYIREHNMGVIVDSYKDIASAWCPGVNRPRFKHALVDLEAGRIDGIAVLKIDRLTRRKDQVRPILNALEAMGGRLFSLEDELDTAYDDDPEHPTELRLMELVAKAEREARRASERMKLAIKHRARKGLPHRGGPRAFGHTDDWRGLVPEEARLLQIAAQGIDTGAETPSSIARAWTAKEVPTPQGKAIWHAKNVANILRSPRMAAKTEVEGVPYDVPEIPAVLDEALWLRVRAKLTAKRRPGRRETRLLSNIAVCSVCGLELVSGIENDGASVYVCKKRPSVPGACGSVNVRIHLLDAKVNAVVVAFLNDKPRAQALLNKSRPQSDEMKALDRQRAELTQRKTDLDRSRFNPPSGHTRLDNDAYWTLKAEIEAEQAQISRRRYVNREAQPLKEALAHGAWTVEEWEAQPMAWRRSLVKLVCERIEVMPTARRGAPKGHLGAVHYPERIKVKLAG